MLLKKPGNTGREDPGFARARARKDQNGFLGSGDGLELFGVEVLKKIRRHDSNKRNASKKEERF